MRLTLSTNRWTPAALAAVWLFSAGCQRLPYIDQSKQVPHDNMGKIALEDRDVKQADFLSSSLPMQLPKIAKPRTTNDPEAQELWPLTLQDAIRIGLDNAEVIRVINLGAQGIPIEGFEPTFLSPSLAAGSAGQAVLGGGGLASVYDPALQETQIAQALSVFDTAFTTQINWGKNTQPFNNAIQGGSLTLAGPKTPVVSIQDTVNYQFGLQKRGATGTQMSIVHNINWLYQNSTFLVTPSVYTTNLQMSITQPLLGSAPLPGQPVNNFSNLVGLEANRAPIVIARLQADESVWNFKLNVMEHVRSIEQQYWILARKHVQLWSSEKAVDLAREIVNREQAELVVGKGTVADVAEAQQRLEQFSLELVTRTSDLLTTERQLRNLLGLPPADNRRIIPVTPPTEARLEPDWDSSVAQMLTFYPDIVRQQIAVRVAELQLVIARNQLLPQLNLNLLYQLNGLGEQLDSAEAVMTGATMKALEPVVAAKERAAGLPGNAGFYNNFHTWQVGFTFQMPLGNRSPLANTRYAQYGLLRQRAFLQQMVHQRVHQLSRYYLEIDANYKQFKTASRLRAAAAQRLDAQRAYYEEGRITIDRFLDAVSQYAQAVATEAEWKTLYNISIIVFEESKGTLLAYNNIAVAEGPLPRKAYVQARDIQNAHRQLPIPHDGPMYDPKPSGPVNPDTVPPNPPPGVNPGPVPAMPAPVGPLGPPPTPSAPFRPAGEPPILSQKPANGGGEGIPGAGGIPTSPTGAPTMLSADSRPTADAAATPASIPAAAPAAIPVETPPAASAPAVPAAPPAAEPALPPLPAAAAEPAPAAAPAAPAAASEELPELPTDIGLPPLPKS